MDKENENFNQIQSELRSAYKDGAGIKPSPKWHTNVMQDIRSLNSDSIGNHSFDNVSIYIIKSAYFAAAAAVIVVGLILQDGSFTYLDSGGWLVNEAFTIIPN